MAIEDRTRHDRLRSLLPRVYGSDPTRHALGVLLEVFADNLREADRFTERALRDRWLRTAAAPRELAGVVDLGEVPGAPWLTVAHLHEHLAVEAAAARKAASAGAEAVTAAIETRAPLATRAALVLAARAAVEARLAVEATIDQLRAIEDAAEDDAARLGGRVARLLLPEQSFTAISMLAIEVLRPTAVVPDPDGDPAPALAALQELLAPLYPNLGAPLRSDRLLVGAHTLQRARWQRGATMLEAAYAPAGPFTALVLVRGDDLDAHGDDLEALLAGMRGLSGEQSPPLPAIDLAGAPHPLELLGAALDLRRHPWEVDVETYRSRVRILAPMLTEGLATARVMLAAALTSLHTEPCPILERPEPDSTRGYGLPPRTLDRCHVCQGGRRRPLAGERCPMRARTLTQATITDNPRTRARLTRSRLDPASSPAGARLRISNDSLFAARPQISLRVPALAEDAPPPPEPIRVVPRFRSLSTGEELVVPTALLPGDELTLRPGSDWQPERPRHRQLWVDPPSGEHLLPPRAWIQRAASNTLEVVDALIMYAAGPRFGKARFAGFSEAALFDGAHFDEVLFDTPEPDAETEEFRFASAELGVKSPALQPGDNVWLFSTLSSAALQGLISDYQLPPSFSLEIFAAASTPVSLELGWWTRPPARFRVRVPRKPAVELVLAQGAATSLRKLVDRLRPAGVFPIIDFAVEPITERIDPAVERRAVDLRSREPLEPAVAFEAAALAGAGETLEPEDRLGFLGMFDVTLFDMSLLAERGLEPAVFDRTVYDHALLHALGLEPAVLDRTYYDHALLGDHGPGNFGHVSFDQVRFA